MKDEFLSIVISIVLLSIISIFIPSGKTAGLIKTVIRVGIIFITFSFIVSFKGLNINYETIFDSQSIEIQSGFLDRIHEKYKENVIIDINELLKKFGIENAEVMVNLTAQEDSFPKIKNIELNLSNAVIISDKEHIFIIEEITSFICKNYNLSKRDVIVYG
jgi:hypothetical protein